MPKEIKLNLDDRIYNKLKLKHTDEQMNDMLFNHLKQIAYNDELKVFIKLKEEEFKRELEQLQNNLSNSKNQDIQNYLNNV